MSSTILSFRPRTWRHRFYEMRLRLRLNAARAELLRIEVLKVNAITAAAQWRAHIEDLQREQKINGYASEETYRVIDVTPWIEALMWCASAAFLGLAVLFIWGLS